VFFEPPLPDILERPVNEGRKRSLAAAFEQCAHIIRQFRRNQFVVRVVAEYPKLILITVDEPEPEPEQRRTDAVSAAFRGRR
jgi:hypothetical protein